MRWLGIFWLILSSGCALLPTAPKSVAHPAQIDSAQIDSAPFALNGRISIDNHGEKHSAGLHWKHQLSSDEILLLTPLGQTVARVYRDDSHATLDDGKKHYQDVDAESLMQQVLGWHLPLAYLHQWVLGLPAADTPAQTERDDDGRITVLSQDGWKVRYLRYADVSPDSMPTRIQLNHEDLQMQLLIDEWEWNPQ